METHPVSHPVIIACPDARPPAYQAAIGLARSGLLDRFVTSSYFDPDGLLATLSRRCLPGQAAQLERIFRRRHDPEIPIERVRAVPSVDAMLRLESRLAGRQQALKRGLARLRTDWFDRHLARLIARRLPEAVMVFSDVGSGHTLSLCRKRGIPTLLSMVHGEVREEAKILEREAARSPEFFPIYLGDGRLDRRELDWLHRRRLRDIALADTILVPSDHIARALIAHGTDAGKIRVVQYAADCRRFRPPAEQRNGSTLVFLFAGGISQRKGISYLLEAWGRVRRPGWRLQLLGPLPANPGPLVPLLEHVELLGRVGHAEMPVRMAAADVFVFPSLFEGSAVVTYEALACGLPCIVTPAAGSVVRDGIEGFEVPPGDALALADRIEQLGNNPALRARMSEAARLRALQFNWPRYHAEIVDSVERLRPGVQGHKLLVAEPATSSA